MTELKKSISKAEIQDLPLDYYRGDVHIVTNADEIAVCLSDIEAADYLGMDTETKPNFVKGQFNPVALLQLATPKAAYLFPLHRFGMPEPIKAVLESSSTCKIGIATAQDMKELKRDYGVRAQNILDLNQLAKRRGYKNVGARNLAGLILGIRISKSKQMSNWEAFPLSESQVRYAATDAWVCLEIFSRLNVSKPK